MGVDTSDDPYRGSFEPAFSTASRSAGRGSLSSGVVDLPAGPVAHAAAPEAAGWRRGPDVAAGLRCDASDRPLLCLSVRGESAVVGSADHGLVELSLSPCWRGAPPSLRRSLYTKSCGHMEWVTDVTHTPDGRVLSTGMDGKLCLWSASGPPRCTDLLGHTGSVSRVLVSASGQHAVSASYDKTVRVWNVASGESGCMRGHRAPVMHLAWSARLLASADRDGCVLCWDARAGTAVGRHRGHATALAAASGGAQLASGGQDGRVCLYDCRQREGAAASAVVHTGAVNDLLAHTTPSGVEMLLSTGAAHTPVPNPSAAGASQERGAESRLPRRRGPAATTSSSHI